MISNASLKFLVNSNFKNSLNSNDFLTKSIKSMFSKINPSFFKIELILF